MPTYSYFCPRCGATRELHMATMRNGPPRDYCRECIGYGPPPDRERNAMELKRDYRADRPQIAAVPQETYSPSLGRSFSDQRQIDDHIKRVAEKSALRTGVEPNLRAMHPSEASPIQGESLDNVYRQQMERGETSPRIIRTVSD